MMKSNEKQRSLARHRRYDNPPEEDNVDSLPTEAPNELGLAGRATSATPSSVILEPTTAPSTSPTTTATPTVAPKLLPEPLLPCTLDAETGSFGILDDGEGVSSEVVSFVYQVLTKNTELTPDALQALETYMTGQMIDPMGIPCGQAMPSLDGSSSSVSPAKSSSVRSGGGGAVIKSSRKRRKPSSDGTMATRRQLQGIDDNIFNPIVGISSEPKDVMLRDAGIECNESCRPDGCTYCMIVEGKVTVTINQTANQDPDQTEQSYRAAIKGSVRDANVWANSPVGHPDIVEVTYVDDSVDSLGGSLLFNPDKLQEYWIPGLTIACFFLALVIIFMIQDYNSPLKKEWEEQRLKRRRSRSGGSSSSSSGSGERSGVDNDNDDDEDSEIEKMMILRLSSLVVQDDLKSLENGDSGATIAQCSSQEEEQRPLTGSEP